MLDNTVNILIGGKAGQGLVNFGQLLAKSLVGVGGGHLSLSGLQKLMKDQ
jgi:Pyruvate/2-oxoacid:ferredoxin oxidoreductase gamma subunit